MSGVPDIIRLMVVEADPVFRTGLVNSFGRFADLHVVLEVETTAAAWRLLRDSSQRADFVNVLITSFGLEFCQPLKAQYPTLPVLVLGKLPEPELFALLQAGVEGYCPRGIAIAEIVDSIRAIAAGQTRWRPELITQITQSTQLAPPPLRTVLQQRWRSSGLRQIDAALADINAQLQLARLSAIDKAFLAGRRRELKAARWLVQRLLPEETARPKIPLTPTPQALVPTSPTAIEPAAKTPRSIQEDLFDRIAAKLQSSLDNLTNTPLEIDILQVEKKRELFYSILRQLEEALNELRVSQVQADHIREKQSKILRDLWSAIVVHFFGRYSTVSLRNRDIEVVPALLQEGDFVQAEILSKIPQVPEILGYLLLQTPMVIEQIPYAVGTVEASDRATDLLENLMIQMANAVIQPLLNRFANVEAIKLGLYDRRLLSTREIERFRNDLSWRYRLDRFVTEPKAMFESRQRLWVFSDYGIERLAIYAPRTPELEALSGIPLVVTLALETRDAISPRLRSMLNYLGSGIVYFLTEVIGRGIGLIGRGILKGIGKSVKP